MKISQKFIFHPHEAYITSVRCYNVMHNSYGFEKYQISPQNSNGSAVLLKTLVRGINWMEIHIS
jgi:hypothetical protein